MTDFSPPCSPGALESGGTTMEHLPRQVSREKTYIFCDSKVLFYVYVFSFCRMCRWIRVRLRPSSRCCAFAEPADMLTLGSLRPPLLQRQANGALALHPDKTAPHLSPLVHQRVLMFHLYGTTTELLRTGPLCRHRQA